MVVCSRTLNFLAYQSAVHSEDILTRLQTFEVGYFSCCYCACMYNLYTSWQCTTLADNHARLLGNRLASNRVPSLGTSRRTSRGMHASLWLHRWVSMQLDTLTACDCHCACLVDCHHCTNPLLCATLKLQAQHITSPSSSTACTSLRVSLLCSPARAFPFVCLALWPW